MENVKIFMDVHTVYMLRWKSGFIAWHWHCVLEKKMFCDYRLVVGQIDELLIYCKYGIRKENGIYVVDPTGCQEQIAIGNYMLGFFSK